MVESDVRATQAARNALDGTVGTLHLLTADTLAEGIELACAECPDVAIIDLSLPDSAGLDTYRLFARSSPDLPVIVLTSGDEGALGAQALHEGAQDLLLREQVGPLLSRSVRYAVERHRAERQRDEMVSRVRRAQKLESMASLAGGVAHDFNNLLVGILGNADLLLSQPVNDAQRECLAEIRQAALRASHLTDQMLAYSGRGVSLSQSVCLNDLIRQAEPHLRSMTPADVSLRVDLAGDLPMALGDPGQLGQLLECIVANAIEACGAEGGAVAIRTRREDLSTEQVRQLDCVGRMPAGACVSMTVSDTGCGMEPGTIAKIFDPFFSTKLTGRGLGMAAVSGIARSHRGGMQIQSRPGGGTDVTLYLPQQHSLTRRRGLAGTVLVLVEDSPRTAARQSFLERCGMRVFVAHSWAEALGPLLALCDDVAAVVIDEELTGRSLDRICQQTYARSPGATVLVSSERPPQSPPEHGPTAWLPRPYGMRDLLRALRNARGRSRMPADALES